MLHSPKQIKLPSLPQLKGSHQPPLPKLHKAVSNTTFHKAKTVVEEASRPFPLVRQGGSVPVENSFSLSHKGDHQGKIPDDNNNCENLADRTYKAVTAMTNFPKREWKDPPPRRPKTFYPEGQSSALANRSRSLFTDSLPYTISVSRSTAAKFVLPKESTFVSNKTVGFVPLEHLAESVTWPPDSDTDGDNFSWINRYNSTNVQSNYIPKGHFPTRQPRFSSAKKIAPNKHVVGTDILHLLVSS